MRMLFGVEPIAEDTRSVEKLAQVVERYQYDFIWIPDSQLIWRELYSLMMLCALKTSRVRIGTGVTNLSTRHPTVTASAACTINELSNGRAVLGLGRGDSSVRLMGERPMSVNQFMDEVSTVRALCSGEEAEINGKKIRLAWSKRRVPIYVAAYGPKMLAFAGRVADGVIIQVGEPNAIKWMIGHVKKGAEEAGRSIKDLDIVSFTACYISDDLQKAREMVRWYPATVSNHIFSLLSRYASTEIPSELLMDMESLRGKYNYWQHDVVGSEHSKYVTDRLVDSFTISGSPERCSRKIRELRDAGVTNVNLYLPEGEAEHVTR